MFVTQGTVFSQIFWLVSCLSILMIVIQKVFIKRIKSILNKRNSKIHTLKTNIDKMIEESAEISQKTKDIELEIYEKIRMENAKISSEMKYELEQNMENMKNNFIGEKLLLEKELKKFQVELLKDIEKKLPNLKKKAMQKIQQ